MLDVALRFDLLEVLLGSVWLVHRQRTVLVESITVEVTVPVVQEVTA